MIGNCSRYFLFEMEFSLVPDSLAFTVNTVVIIDALPSHPYHEPLLPLIS